MTTTLINKAGRPCVSQPQSEAEVTAEAYRLLKACDHRLRRCLCCDCEDGKLTVHGVVPTENVRRMAVEALRELHDVVQLRNEVSVFLCSGSEKSPSAAADSASGTRFAQQTV